MQKLQRGVRTGLKHFGKAGLPRIGDRIRSIFQTVTLHVLLILKPLVTDTALLMSSQERPGWSIADISPIYRIMS